MTNYHVDASCYDHVTVIAFIEVRQDVLMRERFFINYERTDTNIAEFHGVILAARNAKMGATIYTDCQSVCKSIRDKENSELVREFLKISHKKSLKIKWERRNRNVYRSRVDYIVGQVAKNKFDLIQWEAYRYDYYLNKNRQYNGIFNR